MEQAKTPAVQILPASNDEVKSGAGSQDAAQLSRASSRGKGPKPNIRVVRDPTPKPLRSPMVNIQIDFEETMNPLSNSQTGSFRGIRPSVQPSSGIDEEEPDAGADSDEEGPMVVKPLDVVERDGGASQTAETGEIQNGKHAIAMQVAEIDSTNVLVGSSHDHNTLRDRE